MIVAIATAGCHEDQPQPEQKPVESLAAPVLGGEHALQQLPTETGHKAKGPPSFLKIITQPGPGKKFKKSVEFVWMSNDGFTYERSAFPIEMVEVTPDEQHSVPAIRFFWNPWRENRSPDIPTLMSRNVKKVRLIIKRKECPRELEPYIQQATQEP